MPSSPAARSSVKRFEMRVEFWGALVIGNCRLKKPLISVHVLVAAAREVKNDEVAGLEPRQAFDEAGDGVGGFERRNDAFGKRQQLRRIERGLIIHSGIFGAMLVGKPGVLRTNGRIIEARGNRMRRRNLAVFILQNVGKCALENAGTRAGESFMR